MHTNLILESFSLDPMDLLHESYDCLSLYESGAMDLEKMLTEAADGATAKNVFQKIWTFIQNAIKWIGKRISKFIQFIKSLFVKGKKKSVDTIIQELNVTGGYNGDAVDVNIPAGEGSEYTPPNVKLLMKPILMKINDDNSMTFDMKGVMDKRNLFNGQVKQGGFLGFKKDISIKGQGFAGQPPVS